MCGWRENVLACGFELQIHVMGARVERARVDRVLLEQGCKVKAVRSLDGVLKRQEVRHWINGTLILPLPNPSPNARPNGFPGSSCCLELVVSASSTSSSSHQPNCNCNHDCNIHKKPTQPVTLPCPYP